MSEELKRTNNGLNDLNKGLSPNKLKVSDETQKIFDGPKPKPKPKPNGILEFLGIPNFIYESKGGHVPLYASKGMFVPRGTDTVPAMLSPGEFVVNRKSVERGNNRQILENMNNGSDSVYNNRDPLKIDTGDLQNIAKSLSSSFDKFNETVNRLVNFKFELTIASSRIDVVLNTPQAMQQMNSLAKEEILNAVVNEIQIGHLGKLRRRNRK
jgi:hypothetical protein